MRQQIYEEMQAVNRSLDAKIDNYLKIQDRELKKKLLSKIQQCKMQTGFVLQILRDSQKKGILTIEEENELVAKLNDMAY